MFGWLISLLGSCRTCADCKNIYDCWSKIDDDVLDTPECKKFEERDDKNENIID